MSGELIKYVKALGFKTILEFVSLTGLFPFCHIVGNGLDGFKGKLAFFFGSSSFFSTTHFHLPSVLSPK